MAAALLIIGGAWLAWCLLNVALLVASPWLMRDRQITTNGFVIAFPDHLRAMVTEAEAAALIAHEQGHIVHRHALKNLARACLFLPRTDAAAFRQELEADDYAAARGHGPALASALRKLTVENAARYRARRLLAA